MNRLHRISDTLPPQARRRQRLIEASREHHRTIVSLSRDRVVLTVDGEEMTQSIKVEGDPTLPANIVTEEEEHPLKKKDRRPDD